VGLARTSYHWLQKCPSTRHCHSRQWPPLEDTHGFLRVQFKVRLLIGDGMPSSLQPGLQQAPRGRGVSSRTLNCT
jgi:hypothetical protein